MHAPFTDQMCDNKRKGAFLLKGKNTDTEECGSRPRCGGGEGQLQFL